mgnify:CR=1 FL=1
MSHAAVHVSLSGMGALATLDYIVLAIYLMVVIAVCVRVSRRSPDSDELFLAGRTLGAGVVGLSLFASNISSTTLIGLPGAAWLRGGWAKRAGPAAGVGPTAGGAAATAGHAKAAAGSQSQAEARLLAIIRQVEQRDLDGALKKLNLLQLKNEMTAITQRISSGEASDADRARYRELGERLKFS